jgi:hypothetical protein
MKIHLVEIGPASRPEDRSLFLQPVDGDTFDVFIKGPVVRIGVPKDAPIEELAKLLKDYAPLYKVEREADLFKWYEGKRKRPGPPPRCVTNRPAKPV